MLVPVTVASSHCVQLGSFRCAASQVSASWSDASPRSSRWLVRDVPRLQRVQGPDFLSCSYSYLAHIYGAVRRGRGRHFVLQERSRLGSDSPCIQRQQRERFGYRIRKRRMSGTRYTYRVPRHGSVVRSHRFCCSRHRSCTHTHNRLLPALVTAPALAPSNDHLVGC